MKTIISHSIPFKDVLNDLSKAMGTEYIRSCEEYILHIPGSYGEGTIKGINFAEGIGILLYDCTFYEDLEIRFIVNQIHPLKFLFCEKGNFKHSFEGSENKHGVEALQNIIVASAQTDGHILEFKAGVHTVINSIEIDRKNFVDTVRCEIKSLDATLKQLFEDVNAKQMFFYQGEYSLKMAHVFSEIALNKATDFSRIIFFHGVAYNLLSVQITEYEDAQLADENRSVLLKRELVLIKKAAEIIENDILDFSTVKSLADNVGITIPKLQVGFKEIYGKTVNNFVQDKRLEIAHTLIKNTDYNFSEIAFMIGISSKSYFSKIFKDKYNLTPSEIRTAKNTHPTE
tara:strand:+ start:1313 stop:2341 length:1029 start_codon:yes stop_codon:yes gene_type:complete